MILSILLASALVANPSVDLAKLLEKPDAREDRNMAVMLELGWNNLAGAGVSYTYNAHPNVAIDVGGGLALTGKLVRLGARARYNFLTSNLTPFIAFGATMSPGGRLDGQSDDKKSLRVTLHTTPALQGTAGLSWQSDGGFVAMLGLGYSYNLRRPYSVDRPASRKDQDTLATLFGDGPSVSLAVGHAF